MTSLLQIQGGYSAVSNFFYRQGWTDGLPIVPPTKDAVEEMLAYTDLDPDSSVGRIPATLAEATIRQVAINAVMAGCEPRLLPVVVAAVKGLAVPDFNTFGIQATTNPVAVLVLVNGPLAKSLGFNGAGNCLGQGFAANATVGRAVRFVMLNIGGGVPQTMDKATQGQPGKFGMCIAENEELSPWEPFHVEKGFDPGTSSVSIASVTGTQNVLELATRTGAGLMRSFASSCATVGNQNVQLGGGPLIIMCPEHAEIFAADGYSKQDVKEFLYETSRVKVADFPPETVNAMVRHRRPKRYFSEHPEAGIPLADSPNDINIVVAGGEGPHSIIAPSFGEATCMPTHAIVDRSGKPLAEVVRQAR